MKRLISGRKEKKIIINPTTHAKIKSRKIPTASSACAKISTTIPSNSFHKGSETTAKDRQLVCPKKKKKRVTKSPGTRIKSHSYNKTSQYLVVAKGLNKV